MSRCHSFALLSLILASQPGCTRDQRTGEVTARAVARAMSAESTIARYLEAAREGHAGSRAGRDSLLGCQMRDGMYQPIEMLASYRVLGAREKADTMIGRAEVVTVAEEDGSLRAADRFVAVQRLQRDTVTFQLVRDSAASGWVLCSGPQYGFYGSDEKTEWRPAGSSSATARALADSVWRAEGGGSRR